MRVNKPQATEPRWASAKSGNRWDHHLMVISYDDHKRRATPVNKNAYLPLNLAGNLCELTRQLGGDDAVGCDLSSVQTLQALCIDAPQPLGISIYLGNRIPSPLLSRGVQYLKEL